MKYTYKTNGICPKIINFELDKDIVTNVEFLGGGCSGNLQALPKLVDGMSVYEINKKIGNMKCGSKDTSCASTLARVVLDAYEKSK